MELPTTEQLQTELKRERHKREYRHTLRSTLYILLGVAAAAVLIATLAFPVLQVTGTSMEPTMMNGEIVVAVKNHQFETGNMVAFYYNNKILLKRVIARAGDIVNIDEAGNVTVNDLPLDEPYLAEKSKGNCDITLPYQVPDGKIFVMGDHRATSVDSRSTTIGCIADELIVGKVVLRVWPFNRAGML